MKFLRGRKFIATLAILFTLSTVSAGAASALPREPQTSSEYYQCSSFGECLEFAYWGYFLR
ncbi:hypothetical protein VN24_08925 [Paenibacillus beijingensis]|uniref:Secreted protein n=1 Tax=Paenibacillus beijingensis TaxID=1126833 RepID=A0A0D5NI90_9BACL|nr:hypothetical protein VN24_08925 [Paenibacillus beijingensis]